MNRLMLALALLSAPLSHAGAGEGDEFFETRVRPILVEHCHGCHSSLKKTKGGLALDSRAGLLAGGDSGPAIVPGNPSRSRLINAIGYEDVNLQMPPKGKLPAQAIADLFKWVKQGAPWPASAESTPRQKGDSFDLANRKANHWAWEPLKGQKTPDVQSSWPRNELDCFIMSKLTEQGLTPAERASREVRIRRLWFDLVGLPPPANEVQAFIADESAEGWQKLVDRLLASPHFGERWGRHWLDLVRYAETKGHEFDAPIPNAYQFRDYVIRALNADIPYDQLVTEHVAGDLLERPRRTSSGLGNESMLGTGFWFLGEEIHSPVDTRQDQADRFDNRIDVFSKTFLGMTLACARCHDHKYDAISTKDYYSMFGILESSGYRQARFDVIEANRKIASELAETRARYQPEVRQAIATSITPCLDQLLDRQTASTGTGKMPEPKPLRGSSAIGHVRREVDLVVDYGDLKPGQWLPDDCTFGPRPLQAGEVLSDGRIMEVAAAYYDPLWDRQQVNKSCHLDPGALGKLPRGGRTISTPGFVIRRGKVHCLVRGKGLIYAAVNSHSFIQGPLHGRLVKPFDTKGKLEWVDLDLSTYEDQRAHLELTAEPGSELAISMVAQSEEPPLDINFTQKDAFAGGPKKAVQKVIARWVAGLPITGAQDRMAWRLLCQMVNAPDELKNRRSALSAFDRWLREEKAIVDRIPAEALVAPCIQDGTGGDGRVFVRGSPRQLGELAKRRFLEALAGPKPLEAIGSGRLELARQLIDPTINPLLARVIVNRLWKHLFGHGIVTSVDNFGVLGERPTHPELLDYLAIKLIREGWSIKRAIRDMVLSESYQMASTPTKASQSRDPGNRYWHSMPLKRLEGEAIRDTILSLSGRLSTKMGGPSIPIHLTDFLEGRGRPAESGPLDGAGRRSIYLSVRRNFLPPLLMAFDGPTPFSTVGQRSISNVPAQALMLMNDPFVHEQAGMWARRAIQENAGVADMFMAAYSRRPSHAELAAAEGFLRRRAASLGKLERSPEVLSELAHALLNTKEILLVP